MTIIIVSIVTALFTWGWRSMQATEAAASAACRQVVSHATEDPAGAFFVDGPTRSERRVHLGGDRYEYTLGGQVDLAATGEIPARHTYTCTIITEGEEVIHAPPPVITGG